MTVLAYSCLPQYHVRCFELLGTLLNIYPQQHLDQLKVVNLHRQTPAKTYTYLFSIHYQQKSVMDYCLPLELQYKLLKFQNL